MPKSPSQAIPWSQFEELMGRVAKAAVENEIGSLSSFIIYCTLTGYCGLHYEEVVKLRWTDLLMPELLTGSGNHWVRNFKRNNKIHKLFFTDNFVSMLRIAYILANPGHRNGNGNEKMYVENSVLGSVRSNGYLPFKMQYLNRFLKRVVAEYYPELGMISTITLKKTYARRKFELEGQTESALIALSRELNHSSAAVTRAYIS